MGTAVGVVQSTHGVSRGVGREATEEGKKVLTLQRRIEMQKGKQDIAEDGEWTLQNPM